jgi:alkanesulfonate monooxygenase SsuD/methylene tetrahydromethanopterin reductase-like flavin-dependent oxidoreductase (luciferase family)
VGFCREQYERVRVACTDAGRDPGSMRFSAALVVAVGGSEDEFGRRAGAIGREPDELRQNGAAGSPAEMVDRLGQYAEAGASRVYLQVLDLTDLDHLELIASEVMPQVAQLG